MNVAALNGQVLPKRSGDGIVVIDRQHPETGADSSGYFWGIGERSGTNRGA